MRLLIQLRWIAIGGQLITIAVVYGVMQIRLPLVPLIMAPVLLVLVNLASMVALMTRRGAIINAELTGGLLMDVVALAWQLMHSGGLDNPFASLFLLQIVIGAILLKPASSWAIVGVTFVSVAFLSMQSDPLPLPEAYRDDPLGLYIKGALVSFALIAVLLVAFVIRIGRNLRLRDAALATIRQRAAEEDHIVRLGLLASGAAHELGTPLSSLSVLIGDWQRMPQLQSHQDLQDDLRDMAQAVGRCKTIVSGILMSAGEARGIAPHITTMRAFLDDLIDDWQSILMPGCLHYVDRFGEDIPIVADPALRQVIGNVIDNAVEVSPGRIDIKAWREQDSLLLEIVDYGPGFAAEILANFGQPYQSTKNKIGGGLGLFLLVNVARKLGGDALAENIPEGGACVRLRLPVAALAYYTDMPQ